MNLPSPSSGEAEECCPHASGGEPAAASQRTPSPTLSPPSRTEDRTFQLTFLLPSTRTGSSTQSHKLPRAKPKPKPKQQRVKTLKVNTEPTQEGLETRRVYDRARSQTPKRKAYNQEHQRKYRRQNIEKGLCRDCRKSAIEGQTRCETCRDKHRPRCRRSSADALAQKLKA